MKSESQQSGANPWENADNKTQHRIQNRFTGESVLLQIVSKRMQEKPSVAHRARVAKHESAHFQYKTRHTYHLAL